MAENDTKVENKVQSSDDSTEGHTGQRSFIDLPSRFDRYEPLAELIATFILALATISTAWSGYQSARWGGVQSTAYSQAGALRVESTRASTTAGQITQIDIGLFTNWINAFAQDQENLADFYQERFRPGFLIVFEDWMATDPKNNPDAPRSPFDLPGYSVPQEQDSARLQKEAEAKFKEGEAANQVSDNYIFNTVILASVLFLAGIQSRLKSMPGRLIILIFSLSILVYGLINIIKFPIE